MQNKISYKLISLIFLISLIVTFISAYIQIKNQYENKIISFEKNLNSINKNQVPILSQSLWNVDSVAVNIFINNLVQNEKIIYAKVIESDGKELSIGTVKRTDVMKKEFDISKTIEKKRYDIGKLIVIADLSPMYKELKDNAIGIVFTEIIKMLLISLLIILIMKKLLTDPLEKMAHYANKLSLENLDQPLVIGDTKENNLNELDMVAESINTMRINLIKQIKESEDKNNILAQQSKLAAMGEMIGNIAHQWRQPLSLITIASGGIKINHEMDILDDKKVNDLTSKIINSADYLSDTIDDFRDFFKPNKDKSDFELLNTFDKTFTLLNTQFEKNDIVVIKNIEDVTIYGFRNELIQVLINVLNNAKDELKNKKDQKRLILIDTYLNENEISICIKDNAGGVNDSLIDRIFEPYFTTKHQSQGTGIGLYMSKQIIVTHMKGSLSVQNVDFEYEDINYTGAEFKIVINKSGNKDEAS